MVVWTSRLNNTHVDWFDDDDEVLVGLPESSIDESERTATVINIDDVMKNPWDEFNAIDLID